MYHKIREAQQGNREEGFTLIELLVVVIIIGILAAIAIPVFLNQRKKAWDAAAKSDVKNMATAQETYLTDSNPTAYSSNVAGLTANGYVKSASVQAGTCNSGGTAYVVVAKHTSSTNYWYLDSATGNIQSVTALPVGTSCSVSAVS